MGLKTPIRSVASNAISLIATSYLVDGFHISMDYMTILLGGFILSLVNFLVKPILKIISFPINIVTLGFFGFVINAILLYIVIYFVDGVKITDGIIKLTIPSFGLTQLGLPPLGILVVAATVISIINWILKKLIF